MSHFQLNFTCYRWIGPHLLGKTTPAPIGFSRKGIAGIAACLLVFSILGVNAIQKFAVGEVTYVGAKTFIEARHVVVETSEGCRLLVRSGSNKTFRAPVLSKDRQTVAFQVHHGTQCQLATLDINTRTKRLFGMCPHADPQGQIFAT